MRREQPFALAALEEIVIFLSYVGAGTLFWVAAQDGKDFWRGVVPFVALAYPLRFLGEAVARYRGKPLIRLAFEDRPGPV